MSKKLVAYFSASRVTKRLAEKLTEAIGADLFEIRPQTPYSEADLNWKNPLARCNREWIGKKAVPISGQVQNMQDYQSLYIGFPIWYGCAPNIINTFAEQYDLSGKQIALFATSGGSGIGKTAEKLETHLGGAKVADAKVLRADISEAELKNWAVF